MKRVFLSFDYNDVQQARGLKLLNKNPDYDLEFYDESLDIAIDSDDANYVKRKIAEKIARSSVTVCLIGENTYKSKWVCWELSKTDEAGNKIIAMALKGINSVILPKIIKEKKLPFYAWEPEKLKNLIGT